MVDGFHWTRVTSKQLRFLYETVTFQPAPPHMYELAASIDRPNAPPEHSSNGDENCAVRNQSQCQCIDEAKEPQ